MLLNVEWKYWRESRRRWRLDYRFFRFSSCQEFLSSFSSKKLKNELYNLKWQLSQKKIDSLWLDLKKCFLLLAKLLNCERTNIIGAWCQKAVIISNIDRLQIIVTHAEYNIVVYYNRALILFLFAGNAIESNETTQSFMKVTRLKIPIYTREPIFFSS